MNRKQFEKELLDLGFTPMAMAGGSDSYRLAGGTLFGRRNTLTIITTDKDGYSINFKNWANVGFGRSVKWKFAPKSVHKAIEKFFSDFGL